MNALRITSRRVATAYPRQTLASSYLHRTCMPSTTTTTSRCLSTQGDAARCRLHNVLEEYRQMHYTQETHMRFRKDIVNAACQQSRSPKQEPAPTSAAVSCEGMQQVLCNIGLQDRMPQTELQLIFEEEGDASGAIPADRMVEILR